MTRMQKENHFKETYPLMYGGYDDKGGNFIFTDEEMTDALRIEIFKFLVAENVQKEDASICYALSHYVDEEDVAMFPSYYCVGSYGEV